MKKRELKRRIAELGRRIETLESRPQPKQCEQCGVLFLPKVKATMTWISSGSVGPIYLKPMRVTVGDGSTHFIHTPVLCSRCSEAEAKSA